MLMPVVVGIFVAISFIYGAMLEVMAKQVNNAGANPQIPSGNDWGRPKLIRETHSRMFPNSWTGDITWALRTAQLLLFGTILVSVVVIYCIARFA